MPPTKKRILVFDEPQIVEVIRSLLEAWGYESIGIHKTNFIEEAIVRNAVDLIIIPKEMRIKGPSLSDAPDILTLSSGQLSERLAELKDTVIDFEFGLNICVRLRERNILLPVILTTTDDLAADALRSYKSVSGLINTMIVAKPFGDGAELKRAVTACLGEVF